MHLAIANAAIKSPQFDRALDRTFKERKVLQSRLEAVKVDGRFNTLGFVIVDYPPNYFKVARKVDDSIYQVSVGYDLTGNYPPEEDDKVIRLLAGWMRRALQETDGYAAKRTELLEIVNSWEEQAIKGISGSG